MRSRVTDDSGYLACEEDLALVGVSHEDFEDMASRVRPLGVNAKSFMGFTESLARALKIDDVLDAEVYIRGSSSQFFSGTHKHMPYGMTALLKTYKAENALTRPATVHLTEMDGRVADRWPDQLNRPLRRIFDLFQILGMSLHPSDIDVELRSDEIVSKVRRLFERDYPMIPEPDRAMLVANERYSFIEKDYVAEVCPTLTTWQDQMEGYLKGREVTVACFPRTGPNAPQEPATNLPDFAVRLEFP